MLGSTDIKISDNFFLSLNCSELARVSSLLLERRNRDRWLILFSLLGHEKALLFVIFVIKGLAKGIVTGLKQRAKQLLIVPGFEVSVGLVTDLENPNFLSPDTGD